MPSFIWKQIELLVKLKFHEAAGLSDELELKKYVPPPKRDNGLLIVSTKCLNLAKHCELLGIRNNINLDYHRDVVPVPETLLYWRYDVDDGRTLLNLSGSVALERIKSQSRLPATTAEVLAIYRENPNILSISHFIDAFGSAVSKDDDISIAPALYLDGLLVHQKDKLPILEVYQRIGDQNEKGYRKWGAASVAVE